MAPPRIFGAVLVFLVGVGTAGGLALFGARRHNDAATGRGARPRSKMDNREAPARANSLTPRQSARRVRLSDRRRLLASSLLPAFASVVLAAAPGVSCAAADSNAPTSAAAAACQPPPRDLLDARAQLDLAVQASSVQAWSDAADIAGDPLLDEAALVAHFDACGGGDSNDGDGPSSKRRKDTLKAEALDAVRRMREALSKKEGGLTTEDAMTVMKYGTGARVAIDAYFGL